jgi:hypothetical protein
MSKGPLPRTTAFRAVARCFATSMAMVARRQVHLPRGNVGRAIRFADGSTGRVHRETVAVRTPSDPCFLVVSFRLRWIHGWGHTLFRMESILNTPLFVGFPGFVSKLWRRAARVHERDVQLVVHRSGPSQAGESSAPAGTVRTPPLPIVPGRSSLGPVLRLGEGDFGP